ncbi:stAR-related lipid transfer protein 5-like isoform X2 [Anneissia japonica]|uniref:stAR-related lipid transfer protein 5-like isoform X2 n=1 Tax=Anneissia japonica TaxID=1529436 RepID=UPI00142599EB|nr:stAR-related lipid transfer protein 5-like isoform X2 [Anneissia japonica]
MRSSVLRTIGSTITCVLVGGGVLSAVAGCTENTRSTSKMGVDYTAESNDVSERVWKLYKSTEWKEAKVSKEVKVSYKKSTEFDGHAYRAECTIEAPPEKIINFLLPCPKGQRGKWDKSVKESSIVENINEDLLVSRTATHSAAMGLISSREFCDLILIKKYAGGILSTNSKSISHSDCPPRDGCVRGFNHPGGTFCIPQSDGSTKVVNIVQTELGGMLPTSLVESAVPSSLINFFVDLEQAVKASSS